MNLYTNGCSWTWGGALDKHFRDPITHDLDNEKRLSLVWPSHLGKILNAEKVTNLGMGCGSNQRIIRTTFDWLRQTSKTEIQDTIAVIQFAEFSRFDVYEDDDPSDPFANKPQNWYNCKVDFATQDLNYEPIDYIIEEIAKRNKYKFYSQIEEMYITISHLNALQNLFNSFGVKHVYFWQLGHAWHCWPVDIQQYVFSHFNMLDDYIIYPIEKPRYFEIWDYERSDPNNPYSHPSIEGHKQLAHHIYKEMLRKGYK